MTLKMEFSEGDLSGKPSAGGEWIFSGTTQ